MSGWSELQDAVEAAAAERGGGRLAARAAILSRGYREGGRTPAALDADDALAYAAYRLPATYAAVAAALAQVAQARPDWLPTSLLDGGAGPGTVLWAAAERWPSLTRAQLVEQDAAMIALGRRLQRAASSAVVRAAAWRRGSLLTPGALESADLVLLSYVLGEAPEAQRPTLVERLWRLAGDTLVIVEPGTPAGFARIRLARSQLAALGARIVAPCPHGDACPMAGDDWCHFAARLGRSRLQRQVKGADRAFEDEKFSFVAASRRAVQGSAARILRRPDGHRGHVRLRLCTATGLVEHTLARSDGERYRLARHLGWGSALPWPDGGPDGEEP